MQLRERHVLIKSGLHGYIRHPVYLGVMITVCAVPLFLYNWIIGFFRFVHALYILIPFIYLEEQMMLDEFVEHYLQYVNQTGWFMPKLFKTKLTHKTQ